jgi:putative Holliday junction resolvase
MTHTGRLLGIDHGIKRIGLAVSDFSWLIARELMVINRKSRKVDFELLNRIIEEQHAVAIVIGLPSNLDLDAGVHTQADTVRLWVERFAETTDVPIILWDEQMSSVDAQELSRQRKRKVTDPIDDLAARLILQSYMDALREGLAHAPDFESD